MDMDVPYIRDRIPLRAYRVADQIMASFKAPFILSNGTTIPKMSLAEIKKLNYIDILNDDSALSEAEFIRLNLSLFYNIDLRLSSLKMAWDEVWDVVLKEPT